MDQQITIVEQDSSTDDRGRKNPEPVHLEPRDGLERTDYICMLLESRIL